MALQSQAGPNIATTWAPNYRELKFLQWSSSVSIDRRVRLEKTAQLGYDLKANENIPNGTVLLEIPPTIWKVFSAKSCVEEIKSSFPEIYHQLTSAGAIYLPAANRNTLHEASSIALKLMTSSENGQPYAQLLQSSSYPEDMKAVPHPLLMPDHTFLTPYLQGTILHSLIKTRQNLYGVIARNLFQDDLIAQHKFLWAIGTVLSRGVSGKNLPFTMIPIFDFVNHAGATVYNAMKDYDPTRETFQLKTIRDVAKDCSVRISYGQARDNNSFMTIYGFAGNQDFEDMKNCDKFSVRLQLHGESAPGFTFLQQRELRQTFQQFLAQNFSSPTFSAQIVAQDVFFSHRLFPSPSIDAASLEPASLPAMEDCQALLGSLLQVIRHLEGLARERNGQPPLSAPLPRPGDEVREVLLAHLQSLLNPQTVASFSLRSFSPRQVDTSNADSCLLTLSQASQDSSPDPLTRWRSSCATVLRMELLPVFQLLLLTNRGGTV